MGLIKFILILILAYYLLVIIVRIFLPLILRRYMAKAQQHIYEQSNYQNNSAHSHKTQNEGEVRIAFRPENKNKRKNETGEYVDFEEID